MNGKRWVCRRCGTAMPTKPGLRPVTFAPRCPKCGVEMRRRKRDIEKVSAGELIERSGKTRMLKGRTMQLNFKGEKP